MWHIDTTVIRLLDGTRAYRIARNSARSKIGLLQPLSRQGFHRIAPQFRCMHVKSDEYMTHPAVNFHVLSMSCQETDAQTSASTPGRIRRMPHDRPGRSLLAECGWFPSLSLRPVNLLAPLVAGRIRWHRRNFWQGQLCRRLRSFRTGKKS